MIEFWLLWFEFLFVIDVFGCLFLLLVGYEFDFVWNVFVSIVFDLVVEFEVFGLYWVYLIVMFVLYMCLIGMMVSGNWCDLVVVYLVWCLCMKVLVMVGYFLEFCFVE